MTTSSPESTSPVRETKPVILARGVNKTYASSSGDVRALVDMNITVEEGDFVSLIGPSGCGKTTFLRILGGLLKPTSGEILIRGNALYDNKGADKAIIRTVGFVFQDANLLPWRTIAQNVTLPLEIQGVPKAAAREAAQRMIELVGLTGFEQHHPRELSGGMRQRASIARSLAFDPVTLLMDEPFGALDAMTRDQMNIELQRIWSESGKTVLLVTHSIAEAVFLSSRILILSARPGRLKEIVEVDLPRPRDRHVYSNPRFGELVAYLRDRLEE